MTDEIVSNYELIAWGQIDDDALTRYPKTNSDPRLQLFVQFADLRSKLGRLSLSDTFTQV